MENLQSPTTADPGVWDRICAAVKPSISATTYDTWFKPTSQLGPAGPMLKVRVPNALFAEWMRSQYLQAIRSVLPTLGVPTTDVEFVPERDEAAGEIAEGAGAPGAATPGSPGPTPGRATAVAGVSRTAPAPATSPASDTERLNIRYSFDNFVVSPCNNFAHAAALAVSEQPGRTYNPLFIHGGVGLGKTHLMQAIGLRFQQLHPGGRLRYRTSEQFMNELISAIRFENTPAFREQYRSVDMLLIDDIQFLTGKESTQEEFFHTFNALYDSGRQIVITSDCPPRSIDALEERLRSRFEWGIIADIQPPPLETKIAILAKMSEARSWSVPPEVLAFVAGNVNSNVRELEGCLTTLMAQASVTRKAPSLELARDVLRSMVPTDPEPVTIETVLQVVARHFNLRVSDLKSRTNAQRIAYPRQVAMYLCKRLAKESLPTIGAALGGKHHTTVLHAVRKIEEERTADPAKHRMLVQLEEQVR